jgi:hypothetical protein
MGFLLWLCLCLLISIAGMPIGLVLFKYSLWAMAVLCVIYFVWGFIEPFFDN